MLEREEQAKKSSEPGLTEKRTAASRGNETQEVTPKKAAAMRSIYKFLSGHYILPAQHPSGHAWPQPNDAIQGSLRVSGHSRGEL
jgi:hypothetical protein